MKTYSYTEFAAQQRAELSEGEQMLSTAARVRATLAAALDTLASIAARQRVGNDARARRDAREQFAAQWAELEASPEYQRLLTCTCGVPNFRSGCPKHAARLAAI
jgi:hypothetical protein